MKNNFKKFIRRMGQMHLEHSLEISSLIGVILNLNYSKKKFFFQHSNYIIISDNYMHILFIKFLLFVSRINGVTFLSVKSNCELAKNIKKIKPEDDVIILSSFFLKYHFILSEIKKRDNFFII